MLFVLDFIIAKIGILKFVWLTWMNIVMNRPIQWAIYSKSID